MAHKSLTIEEREARLRDYHDRDAIIRNDWWDGKRDGVYERVCLLAAWSPEAAHSKCATSCPADAMPRWLACLTPEIDDEGTVGAWSGLIRRYVNVIGRVVRLPGEELAELAEMVVDVAYLHAEKIYRAKFEPDSLALQNRLEILRWRQPLTSPADHRVRRILNPAMQDLKEGQSRRYWDGIISDWLSAMEKAVGAEVSS